ncbi:MAG: hypothetical protein GY814_00650 [Gammaproteobacteria bacterium]|nr:hypothetical protein [Gammaproteobacteria bacterium]
MFDAVKAFAMTLNGADSELLKDPDDLPLNDEAPIITNISVESDAVLTGSMDVLFDVADAYGLADVSLSLAGTSYAVADWGNPRVTIDTTQLSDGPHSLVINAENIVGEITTATRPVVIANDGIYFSNLSPSDNGVVAGIHQFRATVSHASGMNGVAFFINNSLQIPPTQSGDTYVLNLDTTWWPDGARTFKVRATNGIGTIQEKVIPFVVNNESPLIEWALEEGSYLENTFVVSAAISDSNNNGSVSLYIDDNLLTSYHDLSDLAYPLNTKNHSDGPYRLKIIAEDEDGNQSTETRNVIIDNTPPVVWINSPRNGDEFDYDFTFSFYASDANGFGDNSHEIYVGELLYSTTKPPNSSCVINPHNLCNGYYDLKVVVTDASGKKSEASINVKFSARSADC